MSEQATTTGGTDEILLELNNVHRAFAIGEAPPVSVLRGVDLVVRTGDAVAITGPSGSGKSTLLNIAGGLDRPDSGSVTFSGTDLATATDREVAHIRNHGIGFVFQLHHLLPYCTVMENVLLPTLAQGSLAPDRRAECARRAAELLERVGLTHRSTHLPGQISVGERQRAAVARALINSPRLLLADEPTGSLDRDNSAKLVEMLMEVTEQFGLGMVMVTHSREHASRLPVRLELRDGILNPTDTTSV
jgi:lipoprotein-releasing system ATP-binding protein